MYTEVMPRVRRVAWLVAVIWLLVQAIGIVAVPVILHAGSRSPIECTCVHDGNHHDCPMHHKAPVEGRACFQATDAAGLAALGSLLGQVGLTPAPSAASLFSTPPPPDVVWDVTTPMMRPAPPDPPPPRG